MFGIIHAKTLNTKPPQICITKTKQGYLHQIANLPNEYSALGERLSHVRCNVRYHKTEAQNHSPLHPDCCIQDSVQNFGSKENMLQSTFLWTGYARFRKCSWFHSKTEFRYSLKVEETFENPLHTNKHPVQDPKIWHIIWRLANITFWGMENNLKFPTRRWLMDTKNAK